MKRGSSRQQIKGLKYEPDFLISDARQLIVGHIADQIAVQVIQALASECRDSRSDSSASICPSPRTHDRDIFAAVDLDIDARDSVDLLIAHDVGFPKS